MNMEKSSNPTDGNDKDKKPEGPKPERPTMKLLQIQEQNLEQQIRQEYDWDLILTESPTNPFPLAPKDLVERGEVNEENYIRENAGITAFCAKVMGDELKEMISDPHFGTAPKGMEILGAGLMRDLWWILKVENDLKIKIKDKTETAIKNAQKFAKEFELKEKVEIKKIEIEEAWKKGEINEEETIAYYGGQFIQNQDRETMKRMMHHFGEFLKRPSSPPRRIYLLHPRGEDNPADKVEWSNTTPYTDVDLIVPVEEGFGYSDASLLSSLAEGYGGKVQMKALGTHNYFHQKYTLLRIMAAQ